MTDRIAELEARTETDMTEDELKPLRTPYSGVYEAHTDGKLWWVQSPAPDRHVLASGLTEHAAARIVACVNACAGIPNPDALREVVEALRRLMPADFDEHPNDFADDWHFARAALAKLDAKS